MTSNSGLNCSHKCSVVVKGSIRAVRRHHRDRMRARAKKVVKARWSYTDDYTEEDLEIAVARMADNLKDCSCWMCGNPRRHMKDRLTIQEQRQLQGGCGEI